MTRRTLGLLASALVALTLLGVLLAPARSGAAAAAARTAPVKVVEVKSNYFAPARLTVKRNTRVRWTWRGSFINHDVVVRKGPQKFRSPLQSSGTYTRTMRKPGTYRIYCSLHAGMTMTLKVRR